MAEQEAVNQSPVAGFVEYVKQALEVVQLKPGPIDALAGDERAFAMGLGIVAIGGVAGAIGTLMLPGIIFYPILMIVGAFIGAGLLHLLATLAFKGQAEFMAFFRPFSHTFVLTWVTVIPILGWMLGMLANLWMLVVTVVIIERVYRLDRAKAIATVAILVGAGFLLVAVFGGLAAMMVWMMMARS